MRRFYHWVIDLNRRADADLTRRCSGLERWSLRLGSGGWALLVCGLWLVPILWVKVKLLRSFILTSDMAYYENILYNTGVDASTKSVDFLYAYRDVIYYHSRTFLTEHFSPTFGLVAPFYQLFRGPLFLTLLQPLLIALAGFGIYRLAARLMQRAQISAVFGLVPILFLIVYLCNYSNLSATVDSIYGFHHDSLIPPLLLWTLVCIVEARWKTATVLFLLLLGMKENLPIILAAACGYGLIFNGWVPRKKAALGLLFCLAFFAGCYFCEFKTHNRHVALLYQFQDFQNIYAAVDRLNQWPLLNYFLPVVFTPFLALPAFGELSMELMGNTVELDWHSYPLMALLIAGTLFTGIRVLGLAKNSKPIGLSLYFAFLAFLVGPLVVGGFTSYRLISRGTAQLTPLVDAKDFQAIASFIPRDARLATTSDLLASCANRRYLIWPELGAYAEFILVNRRSSAANQAEADKFVAAIPDGDDAATHFRTDIDAVLLGYPYDASLMGFIDYQVAHHLVVPVKSIGSLTLYRAISPWPAPAGVRWQ